VGSDPNIEIMEAHGVVYVRARNGERKVKAAPIRGIKVHVPRSVLRMKNGFGSKQVVDRVHAHIETDGGIVERHCITVVDHGKLPTCTNHRAPEVAAQYTKLIQEKDLEGILALIDADLEHMLHAEKCAVCNLRMVTGTLPDEDLIHLEY